MIKIAICDDERELREATAARLREYFAEEALIAPGELPLPAGGAGY